MEPEASLYPDEVKNPEALDGTWVGIGIEAFKELYPRGSDGMDLDKSGVLIGDLLSIVFLVGIILVCGNIVEWAI
jgi:hypothetical protein